MARAMAALRCCKQPLIFEVGVFVVFSAGRFLSHVTCVDDEQEGPALLWACYIQNGSERESESESKRGQVKWRLQPKV